MQAEIEVYDDDTIGILTSFRAMSDCKEVESSARTIAFGDCMVTTIHRTKTTSCTGTFWSHAVDLTEYKTLSIDIAMDQVGDGSAGYNNLSDSVNITQENILTVLMEIRKLYHRWFRTVLITMLMLPWEMKYLNEKQSP